MKFLCRKLPRGSGVRNTRIIDKNIYPTKTIRPFKQGLYFLLNGKICTKTSACIECSLQNEANASPARVVNNNRYESAGNNGAMALAIPPPPPVNRIFFMSLVAYTSLFRFLCKQQARPI